jgi:Tol biopolymer transport system component
MRIDRRLLSKFRFRTLLATGIALILFAGFQISAQTSPSQSSPPATQNSAAPQPWKIVFDRNMIAPRRVLDGTTPQNIFSVSTDKNSEEIKLTTDNLSSRPVSSPDGKKIAFVHDGKSCGIFVMDADGTNVRQITDRPIWLDTLAWSPDSKILAFDELSTQNLTRKLGWLARPIYVVNIESGAAPTLLVRDGASPAWSPNGTDIAYTCVRTTSPGEWITSVCMISASANSTPRTIVENARNPSWSPDGQQILYLSTVDSKTQLFVAGIDGAKRKGVSDKRYDVVAAAWSPDGKLIAYTSTRTMDGNFSTFANFEGQDFGSFQADYSHAIDPDINRNHQQSSIVPRSLKVPELFVTNTNGTSLIHVGPKQSLWCEQFFWSPDSSTIAGICGIGLTNGSGYSQRLLSDSIYLLNLTGSRSKPRIIAHGVEHISSAPVASSR